MFCLPAVFRKEKAMPEQNEKEMEQGWGKLGWKRAGVWAPLPPAWHKLVRMVHGCNPGIGKWKQDVRSSIATC